MKSILFKDLRGLTIFITFIALVSCTGGSRLSKENFGPLEIKRVSDVVIDVIDKEKPLNLSIHYPIARGKYPLIVFFHGALCEPSGYSDLADYWSSRGYVVIMPGHPDFGNQGRPDSQQALLNFFGHVEEMSSIVDSLDEIVARVEPLQGNIDSNRIAAAGHSMGALISSAVTGLKRSGINNETLNFKDDRFDVAVLLSGPGPLPNTPKGAWDSMTVPTLATTGTKDHANRGGEGATWKWRLGTFELTPPGDKYALIVDKADHFLGGMLCPKRATGNLDQEAFLIVADTSIKFLDAYLKKDEEALQLLNNDRISDSSSERAELRKK
ncbi:MAG: alpha/beta fold hydrolase [Pseudomonadota bacterium]|nr:alpha/beta fold hydrolase [Pseudomonadota bacterium]